MLKAICLRTEYLEDPVAIDIVKPRFFWKLGGNSKSQTAYRIIASDENNHTIWDTNKVFSNRFTGITYSGPELKSRDRILWKVKVWDETDTEGEWSDIAYFEMGLLKPSDWKAKWITGDYKPSIKERYPADYFSKQFQIDGELQKARLYITACGLYEAEINGLRVGNQYFTPGFTDYKRRLQYQTYDITDLLISGNNCLEIVLGDGWYRGKIGALSYSYVYDKETKVLAQLEIMMKDGRNTIICSDDSFSWSNDGPIRANDLKDGEIVIAGMIPSYRGRAKLTTNSIIPVCSNNVPVQEKEIFTPTVIKTPKGATVLDFGQNIAGYVELRVKGKKGHKIQIRLGETLETDGEFTQQNFQCNSKGPILQQLIFTCSGKQDYYKQKFAVSGFRYALVENWPGNIEPENISAIAVYSAMKEVGEYNCSNPLINQLVKNAIWSTKGNFLDVPTDCPTRERAGWTGDAQIYFNAGSYLMDTAAFFRKWMDDLTDRQADNGIVHCIVPTVGNERYLRQVDGCVGWADAAILIPYRYWKMYGDQDFLQRQYGSMKKYASFEIKRVSHTYIGNIFKKNPYRRFTYDTGQHFGEWLEPESYENFILGMIFPRPEEATAYFSYTMGCMAEIAEALGLKDDKIYYSKYAEGSKKAYEYLFVKEGDIDTVRQAKLVRPLALHILSDKVRTRVYQRFVELIKVRNYTIGTGFLSTPFVLPLLSDNGNLEEAYRMLEQEEAPGWLYQVKQGATTIWESWTGLNKEGKVSASYNHYSFGAVCEWLFAYSAGIKVSGINHFVIAPKPGGTLKFVNCSYDSVFGKVESCWERNDDSMIFHIKVPAGTTAEILLPNGRKEEVKAGEYEYIV